jgi:hypothetical protein
VKDTKKRVTQGLAWGLTGVLAVVLLGWVSLPYTGQWLPFTRPYVWLRLPRAVVSINGKPSACRVYRSFDGRLLLPDSQSIINPAMGDVEDFDVGPLSDDTGVNHFIVRNRFALVMDAYYRPGVDYPLSDVCHEPAPHVIVRPRSVEFNFNSASDRPLPVRISF